MKVKLKCPNCGGWRHEMVHLASYPVQYEYQCCHCLWGIRYFERKNSSVPFTQEELNELFKNGIGKVYNLPNG